MRLSENATAILHFNIWAQLFDLYTDGLISQEAWDYWDAGYRRVWKHYRLERTWEMSGENYDPGFQRHIGSRCNEPAIAELKILA